MVARDLIPLYDGAIRANRIGGFQKNGIGFDIIKPGYDSQGCRRTTWTQFVVDGIPVFEVKIAMPLERVLRQFDERWARSVTPSPDLLEQALKMCQAERRSKFKDGKSGVEPAPALTVDGRTEPKRRMS